jgi:hypothetical protein
MLRARPQSSTSSIEDGFGDENELLGTNGTRALHAPEKAVYILGALNKTTDF